MSTVSRKFVATPGRSSSDTWKAIAKLVGQNDAGALAEFSKVEGVAACLVNDEHFSNAPFVVKNKGPRLRVYCLYGEDAITGEEANEADLSWKPAEGDWTGFLPCSPDDFETMKKALGSKSSHFQIYDFDVGLPEEKTEDVSKSSSQVSVDWNAFKKL